MNKWFRKAMLALSSTLIGCMALFGMTACKGCGTCEHVWDEGTVTVQKTCTTDGAKVFKCQECEEEKTEVIPAGHDYAENVVEATCYSGGYTEKTCSACGDYQKSAVTQETSCSYVKESVAATCTTDGYDVYTCKWCDKSYKNVTLRATGHKTEGAVWVEGEDELVDGCLYNHVETTTCTVCQETVTHYEPVYKHTYVVSVTPATCTVAGEKVYACDECGEARDPEVIAIDANAHNWDDGVLDSETGITTYTCDHNDAHTKQVVSFKTQVEATVPSTALQSAGGQVELQNAEMKMDADTLAGLGGQDITLKADTVDTTAKDELKGKMDPAQAEKLGDSEVFNFTMTGANNTAITTFGGKITVTVPYELPYGEDPENIAIWFINDEGVPEAIQATYSVINGSGFATFETSHFSFYTVVRLTPAERCGLYGHKWETRTVVATCGVQGYTVSECVRCHKLERSAFTPALTHDYEASVIAPTCSAMGYTTYTCKNCGDKYVSDYTNEIAHNYEDSVKEPTCTADGYTTHTCTACGKSYTDSEVSAKGHTYANGSCSVCGRKDPNVSTNFYFNLIESISSAETYYFEISDLSMTQTQTYNNGDVDTISYEMKLARAQLGFDDKGIVGKGEGTLVGSRKATGSEVIDESYFADVEFLFTDGYVYAYVTGTGLVFQGNGRTTMIMSAPQESLMAQMEEEAEVPMTVYAQMLMSMTEGAGAIVDGILAVENSPLNSVMRAIVEYVYTKTETADGYSFELNENRLKEVYNIFGEKKVSEIFDLVFGAESYASVQSWLVASLDKKVSDVEAEAKTELVRWGVDLEAVYDWVDSIMEMMGGAEGAPDDGAGGADYMDATTEEELTGIRAMIAEMKDTTVLELINAYLGEMTKDEATEMINGYATQIGDMMVTDLMSMMQAKPETDDGYNGEGEFDEAEDEVDFGKQIDEMVAYLNKIPMTFTTDKTGALIDYTMSATDLDAMGATDSEQAYELDVKQSMTVKFVVNGTFAGEFGHIVKEAQVLAGANNITEDLETEEATIYVGADGKVYAWKYYSYIQGIQGEPVEETKNGVACVKMTAVVRELFVLNENMKDVVTAMSDCQGWWMISAEFDCYETILVNLWYDAEENLVASEVLFDGAESYWTSSIDYYYNPATGEYAGETQHSFKFIKKINNPGCSDDYDQYLCTVCGMEELVDNEEGGHKYARRYVLKDGSTTCEDGVYAQEYCETCGRIDYQYTTYNHGYNYKEELVHTSDVCGEVYARIGTCACGQQSSVESYYSWRTDCEIDRIYGHEDDKSFATSGNVVSHYQEVYGCTIQGCGFTYTREYKSWYEYDATAEETCTYHYTYTYDFGADKTYTAKTSYAEHRTSSTRVDTADGGYVETWTCSLCNQVTSIETCDKYDRRIRCEYPISNSGWYRVFASDCSYVEYGLDGTQRSSGTNHATVWMDNGDNQCTQYTLRGTVCKACDWHSADWQAPDYWYYNDHEYKLEGDTYVCQRCGTENETGADGWIVLEDMLENGVIKVGYFNKYDWWMDDAEITVIANYGAGEGEVELQGDLFTQNITSPAGRREAGIVTVDMDALATAVQDQCADIEVETISVVFWVLDESATQFDPETGDPIPFYLAYALTFTVDEFGGFNG